MKPGIKVLHIVCKNGELGKRCTQCKTVKPLSGFHKLKKSVADGRRSECKVCASKRAKNYFAKHGDTIRLKNAKRERLATGCPEPLTNKPGKCEICGKKKKPLCVDHDHDTGLFRGWLCRSCNLGLGLLGDGLPSLNMAIQYLRKANKNVVGN